MRKRQTDIEEGREGERETKLGSAIWAECYSPEVEAQNIKPGGKA